MKKTSFQIQQYDFGWYKITRRINSETIQCEVMNEILERDKRHIENSLLSPRYAPLYRMRLRDKSWFYFTANPSFNIQNGKLIVEEDEKNENI